MFKIQYWLQQPIKAATTWGVQRCLLPMKLSHGPQHVKADLLDIALFFIVLYGLQDK